ncbi:hypothetical protein NQ317_018344 [Molorchus minor]|uniref:FAM69 protein-kinase domain-containing protein n=1 Tax=Molorchus minor TaxID=1323400 RepID=A0ABQ9J6I8_9CUCU|nr:hypothetical protein NQ317_018344 [Molorchus minor]
MLLTRRLPGLLYTYRYTVYSLLILLCTFISFLFKWNVVCINLQAWQHVKRMCKLYEDELAVGSLCAPMCITRDMHSLTCHSFQATKEAVFSAEWHNIRLVLSQFQETFNQYTAYDTAVRLSRLKPSYEEKDKAKRHKEMDNLWFLLQDNEYLLSTLFTDKDVFPQLLGTCGPYFAVEYLEPVPDLSSLLTVSDSLEDWGKRLQVGVQILDLLEELETDFREPFHLCDIKIEHFGHQENDYCEKDDDCDFFDCRSRCIKKSHKCSNFVENNNLQIVCEKIFLGWRISNTVIVPGLLMSQHTPSELASVLRQCANPEWEGESPELHQNLNLKNDFILFYQKLREQSMKNDVFH